MGACRSLAMVLFSLASVGGAVGGWPRAFAEDLPEAREFTNSLGMRFVRIEPGRYRRGFIEEPMSVDLLPLIETRRGGNFDFLRRGDFDESPSHTVELTRPFYMGSTEVTNFQFELFDPDHKHVRGKRGLSRDDDEAAIYVNWYEARAFCEWLSDKDGRLYRLPTEAEWEYACRSGTTTYFHTGDTLPDEFLKNVGRSGWPQAVSLRVGETAPNAWGIHDMHGNVEEWCHDWYGPYTAGRVVDPVGYADGDFRVTRGGSLGTYPYYLRSANRMASFPEERHQLIGFRVVLGERLTSPPLPVPALPLHQRDVVQRDVDLVKKGPDPEKPYFKGPRRFVNIPTDSFGPLFAAHNHCPAIVDCPNGDLLACWYTCVSEKDRELGQVASRLRRGADEWEPASVFIDSPDRNDHAPAMWFDGKDTIYHFFGVSPGPTYSQLALVLRTSRDSGATWSKARILLPEHDKGHMPVESIFRLQDGAIALTTDHSPTLWYSRDEGLTWTSSGGATGGNHPGVAQLRDGRLVSLLRDASIDGKMPKVISSDGGKSWNGEATEFPTIGGGQRLVLLRLREGPLFFASFADEVHTITDATGQRRPIRGLFGAVSHDDGKTWPHQRVISPDGPGRPVECTDGGLFTNSGRFGEYRGYLAVCQSADGLIHLISSRQHYAFNLKWVETPQPAPLPSRRVRREVETFDGPTFDLDGWADYKSYEGGFNGNGQYEIHSFAHYMGLNRIVGEGSFEARISVSRVEFHPGKPKPGPGISIGLKDMRTKSFIVSVREKELRLTFNDADRDRSESKPRLEPIALESSVGAIEVRFVWDAETLRLRVFYGLGGGEPVTEFPASVEGLYAGSPLSESTAVYIMMSNGRVLLDHYDVIPH